MLIPAIIPKDFEDLKEQVRRVKDFVKLVQIDICDGVFVKNRTWPYINDSGEFENIKKQKEGLPFWEDISYEAHLMTENFDNIAIDWVNAGVSSIVFHIESMGDPEKIIPLLKKNEISCGIAIKPSTNEDKVLKYLDKIDFLQIMGSSKLGFHGEVLEEKAIEKIKFFKRKFPALSLALDIGVNRENAKELFDLGIDRFVSGSFVFESADIGEVVNYFNSL